jgi:hypothetical protein
MRSRNLLGRPLESMSDGSRGTRKSFAVYNHGSGDLHPLVYTPDGPERGGLCLTVGIYEDLFEVEEEMRGAVS